MATLTFYNDRCDPASQSIMLLLAAKQIPHEKVDIKGDSENAAGIQNGNGRAVSYLAALDVVKSDLNEEQKKFLEYFMKNIQPLFYRTVLTGNPREGLDLFFEALSYLENRLTSGPYFGGKSPDILDYGLFPWIEKIGSWMPEIDHHECLKLQSWVRRMRDEPVVSKVMPSPDQTSFNTYKQSLAIKMEGKV
ncbi:glutathione S-transferase omega-1-like [Styela clava]|uniref:glutathione S-transferase omega-1-like n=1 Tax=Styela clava TaxID=7725 RepID=UPI0019396004|nr:glutathione S-transferase omega-1-like [Styela clava]